MKKKKYPYSFGLKKTIETYQKQDGKCLYCYRKFSDEIQATWEHILPVSKGGDNSLDNLALACHKCNLKRGNIPVERFLDGYVCWNLSGRMQGDENLQTIMIEKKVRGPRKWYHKFIGYSL